MIFHCRKKLTNKFAQHFFRIDLYYQMMILHPNLNVLDIRCDSKDNTKTTVAAFQLWSLRK